MISHLTPEELLAAVTSADQALLLMQSLSKGDEPVIEFRRHALIEFYRRRWVDATPVTNEDFAMLTSLLVSVDFAPIATALLGEAAQRGILNEGQCARVIAETPLRSWAHDQIATRLSLYRDEITLTLVEDLVTRRMPWAVLECIEELSTPALEHLQSQMDDKSILTRNHRHVIRERISGILKSRAARKNG
jgi:hypothetical protein